MITTQETIKRKTFSRYEVFVIAMLAFLQFTVVLDFMVLSPLGAQMMEELKINASQFGLVVSAYAFSAGAAGILAAGFADRFDRKKMLLFFYAGFIVGTFLCATAPDYPFLFMARIVTGLFGGVMSSISFAIITDLFAMDQRGRVMGFVQAAFAASQVLGIPVGLWLANHLGWHSPFWMIAVFCVFVWFFVLRYMQPVDAHLKVRKETNPFIHLGRTLAKRDYLLAFAATTLLAMGGFMIMPFASAFSINNLKISMDDLPLLYAISGVFTIISGPLVGKLSDKIGKFKVYCLGSLLSMMMMPIYTNLGETPFWIVATLNVVIFVGVSSRIISSSALMTGVPSLQDRGAVMSISSAVQQISGGIGSMVAGLIVVKTSSGALENYDILGYIVMGTMLVSIILMYRIDQMLKKRQQHS